MRGWIWRAGLLGTLACRPPETASPASRDADFVLRQDWNGLGESLLAVAVHTPDSSPEASHALSALFAARTGPLSIETTWDGYVATFRIPDNNKTFSDQIVEALTTPVRDDEPGVARAKEALMAAPRGNSETPLWDACMGEKRPTNAQAISAASLEAMRRASHVRGRVGVGLLGASRALDAISRNLSARPLPNDPHPEPDARVPRWVAVRTSTPELRIAHFVPFSEDFESRVQALRSREGPLVRWIESGELPVSLESITHRIGPRGGCIAVRTNFLADPSREALLDTTSTLVRALGSEERQAVVPEPFPLVHSLALRAIGRANHPSTVRIVGIPSPRDPERLIPELEAAPQEGVTDVRIHAEAGFPSLAVFLGSRCGTEGEEDFGSTAQAVSRLASSATPHPSGAALVPMVHPDGAGLAIHGTKLPHEGEVDHLKRLLATLADAFYGTPLPRGAFAIPKAEPLFLKLAEVSGQRPTRVLPFGMVPHGIHALHTRLLRLRKEPLRVSAILPHQSKQEPVLREWARTLPSYPTAPCREGPPWGPTPAMLSLEGGSARALLVYPLRGEDFPAAEAWALLVRRGMNIGPAGATLDARVMGPPERAALVLKVEGTDASLDSAVEEVFSTLRHDPLAKESALFALDLGMWGRLLSAWRSLPARPPSSQRLAAFAQELFSSKPPIVVVERPRKSP